LMTISKIPSKYVKCPICYKTPNPDRVAAILYDAMAFRDNRPFNPEDPIIVSKVSYFYSAILLEDIYHVVRHYTVILIIHYF